MRAQLRAWLKAGHQQSTRDTFCPIRIANITSLIMAFALFTQLPVTAFYWEEGGQQQSLLLLFCLLLCPVVPLLNQVNRHLYAVWWLSALLLFYVTWATVNLGGAAGKQYYLLLGIVLLPSLLTGYRLRHYYSLLSIYCLAFLTLSALFRIPADSGYLSIVQPGNWLILTLCCAICSYFIHTNQQIDRNKLAREKARADELLSNILPDDVARRMVNREDTIADYYPEITVLFADISDFSPLSRQITEFAVVSLLNELYSEMDQLFLSYHMEKIKTNGDGVMAVCGAPISEPEHAWRTCEAAIKLQMMFDEFRQRHQLHNQLRIGIHSGCAVGGVVGKHKFSYDVWGDTVNLASRLESYGEPGKIHVSLATYQLVRHKFVFEKRESIAMRGMSSQQTFWLVGHLYP